MVGVRIESVSVGKGHVAWCVHFPPLARRRREIEKQYDRLQDACAAVKKYCRREECDPETALRVEHVVPDGGWGGG